MSSGCQQVMSLRRVDFRGAAGRLVASLPGAYLRGRGVLLNKVGHLRLRDVVRDWWEPQWDDSVSRILIQSGSLGTDLAPDGFMGDFMASVRGDMGCDVPCVTDEGSHEDTLAPRVAPYPPSLCIYWPSRKVAADAVKLYTKNKTPFEGEAHFSFNKWYAERVPIQHFRDVWPPLSKREEPAPFAHSKVYMRFCTDAAAVAAAEAQGRPCGWLYVGSHNMSKNAWGSSNRAGTRFVCSSLEVILHTALRDCCTLTLLRVFTYVCVCILQLGIVLPIKSQIQLSQYRAWLPFAVDATPYDLNEQPFTTPSGRYGSSKRPPPPSFAEVALRLSEMGYDHYEAQDAVLRAQGNYNKALTLLKYTPDDVDARHGPARHAE